MNNATRSSQISSLTIDLTVWWVFYQEAINFSSETINFLPSHTGIDSNLALPVDPRRIVENETESWTRLLLTNVKHLENFTVDI